MCFGTHKASMKKSLDDLLDQMMLAYDRGLITSFTYDNLAHRVIMGFMPSANIPVNTLVQHIKKCYPVQYVYIKNARWGLLIDIEIDSRIPRREPMHHTATNRTYAKF